MIVIRFENTSNKKRNLVFQMIEIPLWLGMGGGWRIFFNLRGNLEVKCYREN